MRHANVEIIKRGGFDPRVSSVVGELKERETLRSREYTNDDSSRGNGAISGSGHGSSRMRTRAMGAQMNAHPDCFDTGRNRLEPEVATSPESSTPLGSRVCFPACMGLTSTRSRPIPSPNSRWQPEHSECTLASSALARSPPSLCMGSPFLRMNRPV